MQRHSEVRDAQEARNALLCYYSLRAQWFEGTCWVFCACSALGYMLGAVRVLCVGVHVGCCVRVVR